MIIVVGLGDGGPGVGGGLVEGGAGLGGQLGLVALDGQEVMAAPLAHGLGQPAMAVQGVATDQPAVEGQQLQRCDRRLGLAAGAGHRLGEAQEALAVEHRDHQRGHVGAALLVGPPQALAVDGQLAGAVLPRLPPEGRHQALERGVERRRVQGAEHPAEGVMAGRAVLQRNELTQKLKPHLGEDRHLRAMRRSAQHRRKGDEQYVRQIMLGVVTARVGYLTQDLNNRHPGSTSLQSPQRIQHNPNRNTFSYSHAIPLP